MRSVGWVLVALFAAGCGSDGTSDGGIDATVTDFSKTLSDLTTAPPIDSGNLCATFALAPWPVASFVALDGTANLVHGRAIRILVDNEGDQGCDVPADLEFFVMPAAQADGVGVTAREWHATQSEPCTGLGFEVQKVITLGDSDGLTNSFLGVQDLASSKGILQLFHVGVAGMPGPNPDCTAATLGAACTLDCQCAAADPRGLCIPTSTDGGICAISCSVDADCPDDHPYCEISSSPKYVCADTRALPGCSSGPTCLPGTMCDPMTNRCVPVDGALDGACTCSGDCIVGRLCTHKQRCIDPCASIRDCPTGASACMDGYCQ